MNPLKSLETTIANLVEGAFGRIFRSEVRPMELARKLAREMDEHRTASVSRVYAPNEYSVWLSPQDRARYEGVEHEVIDELCAYLLEHARREELILASSAVIVFHTDERLSLGEFGIQARLVAPPEPSERAADSPAGAPARSQSPGPRRHGQTMIYSTSGAWAAPLEEAHARRARARAARGRRPAPAGPAAGAARSGAAATATSSWTTPAYPAGTPRFAPTQTAGRSRDLGSTNGVRVNGRAIHGAQPLRQGDRVELGSTEIVFELG